jgi:shikimate kinase
MQNSDSSLRKKGLNISLIGMAGAGKSVIGRKLAEALHYKFIDIDERIENKFGLKLQEVLDQLGEQRFLEIEERTILELGPLNQTVISPGGSAIYSAKAMAFLKGCSVVVFLKAPFETIKKQISNLSSRGIVWKKRDDLKLLYEERRPLYETYADITIETSKDNDIDAIVAVILRNTRLT